VPRAGVTRERVVADAAALADEVGLEHVTLSAIAKRLGVSGPALYKHVDGLEGLRRDLAVRALGELTARLAEATVGRSGHDALRGLADAYRAYAREHPGREAATVRAPEPDDAEHIAASDAALRVLSAVLAGYGVGDERLVDAIRMLRAVLHGFATLEAAGGFGLPDSVDASYARMIETIDAGLRGAVWTER